MPTISPRMSKNPNPIVSHHPSSALKGLRGITPISPVTAEQSPPPLAARQETPGWYIRVSRRNGTHFLCSITQPDFGCLARVSRRNGTHFLCSIIQPDFGCLARVSRRNGTHFLCSITQPVRYRAFRIRSGGGAAHCVPLRSLIARRR